ncbi:unnamed protein product [Effrenium voratum]|nr:unnamed protein product [Effrenium voratum]
MDEKYQRIKVLGKGSFGKAYLVKNTEDNELCVVKQMETSAMEAKERNEAVKEAMLLPGPKGTDGPRCVKRALETAGGFAHAPSMGRAEALKAIGRNLASQGSGFGPELRLGGEEWLHHWSRSQHSMAPFATNFHVRDVPEAVWQGGRKGPTLTAQRVFNRGGQEELLAATKQHLAMLPPENGLRAAGKPSGRTDRDMGRLAALNCGNKLSH